ncbi:unnamed protein product [Blepharisma stoltei]|uniref:Uncharacterized protein n=1 Tax=Blepharisma stoltei TaxID=1481888 RepID=A0AAU9IAR9_9CILI|nr:unnamed protein product [Blepharisma stoltei]
MINRSSSSLDLFKQIRNANRQVTQINKLQAENQSDNSASDDDSDEWKKLKKTSKLKLLTAGFLKCAFTTQSVKSVESLKVNPNKFKNSLQHPESYHIMKGLCRLSSIKSKPELEQDHHLSPGFIDMISKTMIKSRNKGILIRKSQADEDKELELEKLKIMQIIREGNNTPPNKQLSKEVRRNEEKKKSVLSKKRKNINKPSQNRLLSPKIPKLLLPLEPIDLKSFSEISPRSFVKSTSPRCIGISERLYPKEKPIKKEIKENYTERIRQYQSPYLARVS